MANIRSLGNKPTQTRKLFVPLFLGLLFILTFVFSAQSVNAQQVTSTVSVGSTPYGDAYDSGKAEIFVSNAASNTVSVISDSTDIVVATVNVGSGPEGIAYDSGKGELFVGNSGTNTIS